MTINRDDIRPLENAVNELCCLQSAWREVGGPESGEIQPFMYGRFFDCVETLQTAFAEALPLLDKPDTGGADAETEPHRRFARYTGDQWRAYMASMHCLFVHDFSQLYADDIEKLEAACEMLEAVTQGKASGCAYGALVVIREVIAAMQDRARRAEVDARRCRDDAEECGADAGGEFASLLATFYTAKGDGADAAEEAEEAFAALIGRNAATPAELRAKMDAFESWRLEYDITDEPAEQIAAIFDDVRRLLGTAPGVTQEGA